MDTAEFTRFMAAAQQTVDAFNALARKAPGAKRPRPLELAANVEEVGVPRWAYLVFYDHGLFGRRIPLERMEEPPQLQPETLAEMKEAAPKTRRDLWTSPREQWVDARREDLGAWEHLSLSFVPFVAVDGQLFSWEREAK